MLGYLNAAAGVPLYRCRGVRYPYGDAYHFVSTNAGCDGRTVEGLLGYVDSAAEQRPAAYLELPTGVGGGDGDGSPGGSGGGEGGGVGAGGSL